MADLVNLIEQTVIGLGYELVDFELSPRARLFRVFIDRPVETEVKPDGGLIQAIGGVTVEDCATVSHQLVRVFTVENIDYDRLEVSSPGMDRPLKKAADFQRFIGAELQMKLRIPEGTQRNFSGVILAVVDGRLRIKVAGEGNEREFVIDNIEKARLVPKF